MNISDRKPPGNDLVFMFVAVSAAAVLMGVFFQGQATERELELKDQMIQQQAEYIQGLKDGVIYGGSDQ